MFQKVCGYSIIVNRNIFAGRVQCLYTLEDVHTASLGAGRRRSRDDASTVVPKTCAERRLGRPDAAAFASPRRALQGSRKVQEKLRKKNVKSKAVTPQDDLKLTTGIVNNINKQISSPEHGASAIIIKSTITILIRISQWY
jgi:hypothetical protein